MERQRITITIKKDILDQLDKSIDGSEIRNRSHAVEFFLSKNFLPKVTKVLILAGGKGINLSHFTYEMPKCMIPIQGKPLLEHTLDLLAKYDFKDIIISVGCLGDRIKEYFGDGSKFGINIEYIDQGENEKGTAQPLRLAKAYLPDDSSFILIYGDVLADINLLDLVDFHNENNRLATMGLTSLKDVSSWGVVSLTGNRVSDFAEKPGEDTNSHLINAGVYILSPKVINYISPNNLSLEKEVFPQLAQEGELNGYHFAGQWFDVGTQKIYENAVKEWKPIN